MAVNDARAEGVVTRVLRGGETDASVEGFVTRALRGGDTDASVEGFVTRVLRGFPVVDDAFTGWGVPWK